ncbi:TPA: restriction endonuclease subunit S [Vibrio alginolyticus]|nr:restriction endonuclease subunit S [Vibrio alginolyticus]
MESLALMPKYEAYKNSGVEWLGAIPVHWNSFPLCAKSKLKSISNNENEELLSVYLDKGVIKFDDVDAKRTNATSSDLTKYQLVEPGDFVLNNQQAWRGSVGVSDYRGIVSPAYLVLSLSEDIVSCFGNYLFRDGAMVANYLVSSKGVGTIQRNLYWPQLKRALVFLPPTEEQLLIACFLDKKTAQIDDAIAIKEQQISLLKERKQIIIQQAVTQGLDPNVPMKDSGVDWIGKIPAHWGTIKLKFVTAINSRVLAENTPSNKQIEYVDIGSVSFENGIEKTERFAFKDAPSRARRLAKEGDIIVSTVRTYLKAISAVDEKHSNSVYSTGFAVLEPLDMLCSTFLAYFTKSDAFTIQVTLDSKGMSYPAINSSDLSNLTVVLPPKHEQEDIVEFIEKGVNRIQAGIHLNLQQIQKLKEYKTTLINSAVTGKIKITQEMLEQ